MAKFRVTCLPNVKIVDFDIAIKTVDNMGHKPRFGFGFMSCVHLIQSEIPSPKPQTPPYASNTHAKAPSKVQYKGLNMKKRVLPCVKS